MTAPDEPCVCGTEFGHDCLAGDLCTCPENGRVADCAAPGHREQWEQLGRPTRSEALKRLTRRSHD